ncbi:hypothetical protein FALBO_2797 [Fusarium albosuccineum]|uniref:Uncharacterized protein n=1 Tax=Fusarium albosuccineum TaxID=1237068 RepID=A0A8H4LJ31_9HYPO|nr:hypothetical protein FALBO_2797 [Fusarium albosuccineum]
MAASPDQQPWSFDVSSLMILVNEGEEEKYRLSQRSVLECLVLAPVVGLQTYIRSYDFLLDGAKLSYFSPDGVKSAPLRYMCLSNAINHEKLLEDRQYTVYHIPDSCGGQNTVTQPATGRYQILLVLWVLFTWTAFAGIMVFTVTAPDTTWVGITNCAAFTAWSVLLRLIEMTNIQLGKVHDAKITLPEKKDAVYILGRNNSAFVLEGTRHDVKYWTTRGPVYQKRTMGVPSWVWQTFTRFGSLLMLLFIFSSIPNGSTMDQVAFIVINGMAQINVLVGQRLNSKCCLARLELDTSETPDTRTEVYGFLVRRFKELDDKNDWIDASGLLPQTKEWREWKGETKRDVRRDVNVIYNEIAHRNSAAKQDPTVSPGLP